MFSQERLLVSDSSKPGSANGDPYDGKNLGKNESSLLPLDPGRTLFYLFFFSGTLYKNRWHKFKCIINHPNAASGPSPQICSCLLRNSEKRKERGQETQKRKTNSFLSQLWAKQHQNTRSRMGRPSLSWTQPSSRPRSLADRNPG